MTKLLMNLEMGLKSKLSQLIDALIDVLVNFEDYMVFSRITLTECFFFACASLRAVWFVIFGAENANYSYFFSDIVWQIAFCAVTLAHLVGIVFRYPRLRISALYAHSLIWMFLAFLAIWSRTTAPAVPTFVPLLMFSLFLIVRISREKQVELND